MTIARRLVSFLTTTADAIPAVAAFLLAWFHFWAAIGDGKGRAVVMHGPWNFWGPPIVAVVAILAAGGLAWRQGEWRTWARATFAGLVWAIPAWLLAVIPGAFLAGFLTKVWPAGGRGPVDWFAGYHHSHVGMTGDGLVMMFVVAGPLALGGLVPMVAASLAGLPRPPATLAPVVSGAATAATVLVVAAFAASVVPARTAEERARTTSLTQARRYALIEHVGANLALGNAARRGSVADIEALLQSDLSPDVANSFGHTPLMLAAGGCHADAVATLLRHGGSVAAKDRQGLDALAHARRSNSKGDACDRTIQALSRAGVR